METLFNNAKWGDVFQTRSGKRAMFIKEGERIENSNYFNKFRYYLIPEGSTGCVRYAEDGAEEPCGDISDPRDPITGRCDAGYVHLHIGDTIRVGESAWVVRKGGIVKKGKLVREGIINAVCAVYNTSLNDIKLKCRERQLAVPRQALCYFLARNTKMSMCEIGRLIKRNHSTVIHSVKVWEDLQMYEDYKVATQNITEEYHRIMMSM